jgi:hypothetical protein
MGQKVNPHGARVGVIYDWSTKWYVASSSKFKTNAWIRPFYMGQRTNPHGARVRITLWSSRWHILKEKFNINVKSKEKRIGFSSILDKLFTFPRLRLKKTLCRLYIPP